MMATSPFRTVRWCDDKIYKILSLTAVWISVRLRGPIPDIFAEHTAISWKMDEIEETVLPLPRRLYGRGNYVVSDLPNIRYFLCN